MGGGMTIDRAFRDRAAAFLRGEEGLRLCPYQCAAGQWTVGYGHRCDERQGPITKAQAEALLLSDIEEAARVVDSVPGLSQGARVALVSFVFNVGAGAFLGSTLRGLLLAGNMTAAAAEFERWVYIRAPGGMATNKGLAARRARERGIFERG